MIGVASGVKKFGRFQVYEDNCGSGAEPSRQSASKLLARPGSHPAFFLEDFTSSSCARGAWRKKGGVRPITPEPDSVEYGR